MMRTELFLKGTGPPSAEDETPQNPEAHEGRANNPMDCLLVGNPSEGFPILYPLVQSLLKNFPFEQRKTFPSSEKT